MKPEFLMLAKVYKNQDVRGWMCSEKIDGTRAFWDGGVTKGMPASEVPFANTVKDGRLKEQPISTGLWSRTGKVVHAPEWWTSQLPGWCLDGELWMGYGRFQELRSEVASQDGNWEDIKYMVFGAPNASVFDPRTVTVRGDYKYKIGESWERLELAALSGICGFDREIKRINYLVENEVFNAVKQKKIPWINTKEFIETNLEAVLAKGGEGLIFRNAIMPWEACRTKNLLKYKPYFDCEVKITGYTSGRLTDKGSKHLGKIGALITEFQGKRLLVSGLTDVEREFSTFDERTHAEDNPGKEMPPGTSGKWFNTGQDITIRYRELSDDGLPKEARYWRK